MGEKISKILKGEITSSVFYILFGLCLVCMPAQTVGVLCKVVFGLVMIGAGIYHILIYVAGKANSTILDLLTGVIVLVLGGFLFFNPQIVIKLLPLLLGAFVLVDSIWKLQGAFRLKKRGHGSWKVFVIGSLLFIGFGAAVMINPFTKITMTVIFAGAVLLVNGIADIVFYCILHRGMKKAPVCPVESPEGENQSGEQVVPEEKPTEEEPEEEELAEEEPAEETFPAWEDRCQPNEAAEEVEEKDFQEIQEENAGVNDGETPEEASESEEEQAEEKKTDKKFPWSFAIAEEEPLKEWKD